eukprot:CAMPEP_0202870414 /NCGR_PEP_ID=MMETSP1391-20130828/15717_1 /ASSEMBLY_ACC=CAM_ASM_000867 /TAXON_ID=1034604 /ORGANISM="Chlamydomonas leiostraca, Strain SAG 11-49" /LENGTH=130 /DNA_ID=CAMNT_0049550985 /DNA_START=63 /DNA_END=455 /DNA_ORIENTATION=-
MASTNKAVSLLGRLANVGSQSLAPSCSTNGSWRAFTQSAASASGSGMRTAAGARRAPQSTSSTSSNGTAEAQAQTSKGFNAGWILPAFGVPGIIGWFGYQKYTDWEQEQELSSVYASLEAEGVSMKRIKQ